MSDELNPQVPDNSQSAETQRNTAQERITSLISEKKLLLDRLEKLEAAQREKETATLAEQNRFKELYESTAKELEGYKGYKTKAEQLEADIIAENELRLSRIPDDKKSLVPEGLPPAALSKYLTKNESLLFTEIQRPNAPRLDGGAGAGSAKNAVKLSDEEVILARSFGMSPEEYLAMKEKKGNPIELK